MQSRQIRFMWIKKVKVVKRMVVYFDGALKIMTVCSLESLKKSVFERFLSFHWYVDYFVV